MIVIAGLRDPSEWVTCAEPVSLLVPGALQ